VKLNKGKHAQTKPVVIVVANRTFALSNSRKLLIDSLIRADLHVVVCASVDSYTSEIIDLGVEFLPLPFYRGGLSILKDISTLLFFIRVLKSYKPVVVHAFNAKPVIFTGVALKITRIKAQSVSVITGLGHAFIHGGFIRKIAGLGYRFSLKRKGNTTVFQNPDDAKMFIENAWVRSRHSSVIVGSGVDIKTFSPKHHSQPESADSAVRVLMVGRLLGEKGVMEFLDAARYVKNKYRGKVNFILVGEHDKVHPDSIDLGKVTSAVEAGDIEFLGYRNDIPELMLNTDIFVLPSYREGTPRTVLEAAACGVPCIGADVPGTRESIVNKKTGYLVPVKNSKALAVAIVDLLGDPDRRILFGKNARKMVEEKFDISAITQKYLDIYERKGVLFKERSL